MRNFLAALGLSTIAFFAWQKLRAFSPVWINESNIAITDYLILSIYTLNIVLVLFLKENEKRNLQVFGLVILLGLLTMLVVFTSNEGGQVIQSRLEFLMRFQLKYEFDKHLYMLSATFSVLLLSTLVLEVIYIFRLLPVWLSRR